MYLNGFSFCSDFVNSDKPYARGGGGDSHMKQTGMLVVSHRGVNFGFWSRLACSGQSANILCRERHKGLIGRGHDLRLSLD